MQVRFENIVRMGTTTIAAHKTSRAAHGTYRLFTLADSYNAFRRLVLLTLPEIGTMVPEPVEVWRLNGQRLLPEENDLVILERFEYLLALLIDYASEPEAFQKHQTADVLRSASARYLNCAQSNAQT